MHQYAVLTSCRLHAPRSIAAILGLADCAPPAVLVIVDVPYRVVAISTHSRYHAPLVKTVQLATSAHFHGRRVAVCRCATDLVGWLARRCCRLDI